MNLLLFICSAYSHPIILIPGSFRSRLNITTNRRAAWYCPKELDHEFLWINVKYFLPPYLKCFIDWMTVDYNETTDTLQNRKGVDIFADDFGGLSGVRGTGPNLLGTTLPYFNTIVKEFEKRGYVEGRDLFGAPYDWRLGAAQPESYFVALKELVEKAYYQNNHTSVSLIGHSLGCQVQHIFLTEKTTPEWRRKFINMSTLIAPSWSGSGTSFNTLWRIQTPFISFLKLKDITEFASTIGTLHIHIPHMLGYQNTTLFIDPDGVNHTGAELVDELLKHQKLQARHLKVAERNLKYVRRWPPPPDVDTNILFNSGIKTALGLKVSSWNGLGASIYQKGDGLVGSAVIEWVIKNWKTNSTIRYHDMNSPKLRFKHKNLLVSNESVQVLLDWHVPNQVNHIVRKDEL
ncbi:Lecithin:cholesterol acyltransferase family protein [Tritrichomonas foetus]|uniref:Lecithin:cholesterol acyltransferase family protein n=1 Tax=Tritrichomonas foetus TaxID=1144522 RepID=A0A1J4J7J9_9EUKA|nr:Lecithin:cholesterol acyltransferase family protein [Tritrichomonas foetus]|eukprot:OHS93421.1 Lecithin:cholesterol acyltransferase family protein [Tritrichomonas foetus]